MKASAEGQFGGANPALLAIRLLDLTMAQLRELTSGQLGAIWNRMACRESNDVLNPAVEEDITTDEQRPGSCLN